MTDWAGLGEDVVTVVEQLAPLVGAIEPAAAPAIDLGVKIIKGVLAEVPSAQALYKQIIDGVTPTADQLTQYEKDYESSYSKLDADITAAEAKNATHT